MTQERYCSICGMDTLSIIDPPPVTDSVIPETRTTVNKRGISPFKIVALILLLQLVIGGVYWWISNMGQPAAKTMSRLSATSEEGQRSSELKQASTYLPKAGLLLDFYLSYPEGASGNMKRISAQVVPGKAAVSELELMQTNGKQYGYAYHYYNRTDGVYLVYDQTPEDYIPILKNNLRPGLSWGYQDEDVKTVWTVLALGERLDLGSISLDNCLLVEEQSDAAEYRKIISYAPGIGRVMEKTADTGQTLMIMCSLGSIDPELATKEARKWSPNIQDI